MNQETRLMVNNVIFVGRKEELKEFTKALDNPQGQAIIVVGNRGMGKTWLVNRMAKLASEHPTLKCGFVRYEVTPTDSPDSTMAIMMDNAFEAGQVKEGSLDGTKRGLEQWRSFLNVFNLGDLVLSLRRDPAKDTRQQFLERLEIISKRMPENGRAIFIVDPEKYMAKESDQTWAIVVKRLPEKIKFIFAQRTEDALVNSEVIDALDNVVRIPSKTLDTLSEEDVDELVNCRRANLRVEISDLRKALSRYKGHPYAVGAALDLVEEGTSLEELPKRAEPTEFAAKQWAKISEKGDDAIKLFEAYAILEVAVPDDMVEYVSEIESTTRKRLQNDKYLRGLLRDETGGRRIYHSILADYILGQLREKEKTEYHKRAAEIYREKLKKAKKEQTKPDELAAVRLPEHVLAAEGEEAFVNAFINECFKPLWNLGLLDEATRLSERALGMVKQSSMKQEMVLSNLGIVYGIKGKLEKAEEMHKRAFKIDVKLGNIEGIARNYNELGVIYLTRGLLEKAEIIFIKSLEISERIGMYEVQLSCYGNLGNIYLRNGELDKAEEKYKRELELSEKIGLLDHIASNCGNMGVLYDMKGELDKAEEMHKKSLEINDRIGRIGEMAIQYGNLGTIYKQRGDLGKTREYWGKARDLFKKIGLTNEMKEVEGWIEGLGKK
jgi:tetratricopeptide (TPR) repeat protein